MMADCARKKLCWQTVEGLYFVLSAVAFPSAVELRETGWAFASALIGYLCGVALCVLGGRVLRRTSMSAAACVLCVVLPMALLALLGQRTPVDLLVNLTLALVSVWVGYRFRM